MKITNEDVKTPTATVFVSEIPAGTVFRGSIWGPSARVWTKGLFYKAFGRWTATVGTKYECVIVRLDAHERFEAPLGNFANIWAAESSVRNYEPLDVELVIKGMQR